MNKKILTSAILGCILATNAMAVVDKDTCTKQYAKSVWATNITSSSGPDGTCVRENTCKSKSSSVQKTCIQDFANTEVGSIYDAHSLANIYAKKVLGWSGCESYRDFDINNSVGQDYFGCYSSDGKYVTFEFDDTNDSDFGDTDHEYTKSICLAMGGRLDVKDDIRHDEVNCYGISESDCMEVENYTLVSVLSIKYDSVQQKCRFQVNHRAAPKGEKFQVNN